MKTLLRAFSVATLMTVVSVALPAQTKTIVAGNTTILNSSFLQYVASFGVTVTDLGGHPAQSSATTFTITEGDIDLQTLAGEVTNAGGYILSGNGNSVRIQNFVLDTTTPANPILTAIFVVNDKLVGRLPLYHVSIPASITLPLRPQGGTEQLNGLGLTLSKHAAVILNNALIISEPVLQPGEAAGTANVSIVLAAIN